MMAAIEKIWGTHEQYRELHKWLTKERPDLLRFMGKESPPEATGMRGASIALFPASADIWLCKHCPLEWLVRQIFEQYDGAPE